MSIQLGLDTNALRHLLDLGGEEVRLKLTQAAIQNFADRRLRITFDDATRKSIEVAMAVARAEYDAQVKAFLADKFKYVNQAGWNSGGWKLTDNFRKEILEAVRQDVVTETEKAREAAMTYAKNSVEVYHVHFERKFDATMQARLEAYINGEVKRRLDEIIARVKEPT